MDEVVAVSGDDIGSLDEASKPAGTLVGSDPQAAPVAFDLDRFPRVQHMVEYSVDVVTELRSGENHNGKSSTYESVSPVRTLRCTTWARLRFGMMAGWIALSSVSCRLRGSVPPSPDSTGGRSPLA